MQEKILIHDPDFPQIMYYITKEELIDKIERQAKMLPEWWLEKYKEEIVNEKN